MATREKYNSIKVVQALAPQRFTSTSTSSAIDTLGMSAVSIIVNNGASTITPSTANKFTFVVKESTSSAGTFTAVAAADLIGEVSGTTIGAIKVVDSTAKVNSITKAAYIGSKRWIRVGAAETGTASHSASATVVGDILNYAPQS